MAKLITPDDGLLANEVGSWVIEKHNFLTSYLKTSSATRNKYLKGNSGSAAYIDLFCGPGKAKIRGKDEWVDGSAVAAWKASVDSNAPFSEVFIADLNENNRQACAERLRRLGAQVVELSGGAIEAAREVEKILDQHSDKRHGLHFAFLDPYGLDALNYGMIEDLAKLKRIDMLIHVSAMDHQRNLSVNITSENSSLDSFVPGWRERIDLNQKQEIIRKDIIEYWKDLIEKTGKSRPSNWELIRGDRNQRLYWLLLVENHDLAGRFWKIVTEGQQGQLFDSL